MSSARLDIVWRTTFTLVNFASFGLGALVLGLVVFPAVHFVSSDRGQAQRRCRRIVHYCFRAFVGLMRRTRVVDYRVTGEQPIPPGSLVIANHPSLVDVIFLVAHLPDAYCVVKEELARNLFTRSIVRGTGFVVSADAGRTVARCVELLRDGAIVVMFPEGTRTVPGRGMEFRHGASLVILKSHALVIPVFVHLDPSTLAKGESWIRVPPRRVRYSMVFGMPIEAASLLPDHGSERFRSRVCSQRLQDLFENALESQREHGNIAAGNQDPDRRYVGA